MRSMIDPELTWLKPAIDSHIASAEADEIKRRLIEAGVMLFSGEGKAYDSYDLFSSGNTQEIALTSALDLSGAVDQGASTKWMAEPIRYLLEQPCILIKDSFGFGVAA